MNSSASAGVEADGPQLRHEHSAFHATLSSCPVRATRSGICSSLSACIGSLLSWSGWGHCPGPIVSAPTDNPIPGSALVGKGAETLAVGAAGYGIAPCSRALLCGRCRDLERASSGPVDVPCPTSVAHRFCRSQRVTVSMHQPGRGAAGIEHSGGVGKDLRGPLGWVGQGSSSRRSRPNRANWLRSTGRFPPVPLDQA